MPLSHLSHVITVWHDNGKLWHNVTSARSVPEKRLFVLWPPAHRKNKKRPQMTCWPLLVTAFDKSTFQKTMCFYFWLLDQHLGSWKTGTNTERKDKYTKTKKSTFGDVYLILYWLSPSKFVQFPGYKKREIFLSNGVFFSINNVRMCKDKYPMDRQIKSPYDLVSTKWWVIFPPKFSRFGKS